MTTMRTVSGGKFNDVLRFNRAGGLCCAVAAFDKDDGRFRCLAGFRARAPP